MTIERIAARDAVLHHVHHRIAAPDIEPMNDRAPMLAVRAKAAPTHSPPGQRITPSLLNDVPHCASTHCLACRITRSSFFHVRSVTVRLITRVVVFKDCAPASHSRTASLTRPKSTT